MPPTNASPISRRAFGKLLAAGTAALPFANALAAPGFEFRHVLASSLYGQLPLKDILPAVRETRSVGIDLWPKVHGSQREELETMGMEKFQDLLRANGTKVEMLTRYDLGPFKLSQEMDVARTLGASVIVCGGAGPVGRSGGDLKKAVFEFAEKLKPHVAKAEARGVKIAIENHGKNLIDAPDSLRWLMEALPSPNLGVALAPYHLPQDPDELARLIEDLGARTFVFYAWEFGQGCMKKMPKDEELQQLPGRGSLDYVPLLRALKKQQFKGFTQIFMHPTPRGFPILETAAEVTAEINRARAYLEGLSV